jgi:hypothetical protein
MSRRTLLRAGVTVAASIAVPVLAAPAHGLAAVAPVRLRRREFRPHVGSRFVLVAGERTYGAKLVKIGDHDLARGHDARFTLLFDVPGAPLPEGIYTLRHARLKAFDLFIAPVGSPVRYEAVVSS